MNKIRIRTNSELDLQEKGLIELSTLLNKVPITWFLSGGTLLGAVRDGDFIPWDWDVEVSVLTEEAISKEGPLINNLILAGFEIVKIDRTYENFKIVSQKYNVEYEILGRSLHGDFRKRKMISTPAYHFEKNDVVQLRGKSYPCPNEKEKYLEFLYNNWRTPIRTDSKKEYFSSAAYLNQDKSAKQILKKLIFTLFKFIRK